MEIQILTNKEVISLVKLYNQTNKGIINIIQNKADFLNKLVKSKTGDEDLLDELINSGAISSNLLNDKLKRYLSGQTNQYEETTNAFNFIQSIKKQSNIGNLNVNNVKDTFKALMSDFETQTKFLENTVNSTLQESEGILKTVGGKPSDTPDIYTEEVNKNDAIKKGFFKSNVIIMYLTRFVSRIITLLLFNGTTTINIFKDVISIFEKFFSSIVGTNNNIDLTNPEIINSKLKQVPIGGTIDKYNYYFFDDFKPVADFTDIFKVSRFLNAFAITMPGFSVPVIITSKQLKQALSPQEFEFVLLHEVGHIKHRHTVSMLRLINRLHRDDDAAYTIMTTGFRNLHDEIQADSYAIKHGVEFQVGISALDNLIKAFSKLSILSKLEYWLAKYLTDINTRIKYMKKWQLDGEQPPLPEKLPAIVRLES